MSQPLKVSVSENEVTLQKGKGRIICRLDGETAIKVGHEILDAAEKALKQCGLIHEE